MFQKLFLLMVVTTSVFLIISPSVYASVEEDNLTLQSESVILIDAKTSKVLYEKDPEKKMYPASITKILTGIIAIEEGNLSDLVTVSEKAANAHGTSVYLLEDEEMELKQLIEGLLINSGNDAGVAISEHLAGSEEEFANNMNNFLKNKIGTENTNFTNAHGLFDEEHYTTAQDMALITKYAMANDTFKEIVGTEELEWKGEGWETTLYNHHQLLRDSEEVTGVKNGFVSQSGFTLVTSAVKDDLELIAVTLKAPTSQTSYTDTKQLLDYGFANFATYSIDSGATFEDSKNNLFEVDSNILFTYNKLKTLNLDVVDDSLVIKVDEEVLSTYPLNKVSTNQDQILATEISRDQDLTDADDNLSFIERMFEKIKFVFN